MRLPDWPQRLAHYLDARAATPFAYGTGGNDCCQFAARAVEAITGTNPAVGWEYTDEAGALTLIADAGGLEALVTQVLGAPVHASKAGRGDVVLAELEGGFTVGVCIGRECVFAAPVGLTHRPRACILTAWSVR